MPKFIADLHIHSRFSRATSKDLDPEHLALWAQKKGIKVAGTGDFTHPGWISELQEKLIEAEPGLFRLKPDLAASIKPEVPATCQDSPRFVLTSEISCIYKKNDKTRKVHHLILLPDFDSVLKLNKRLEQIGNIRSDGRPILGLDSRNLLEIVLETSDQAFFIPAHVWTPWFSLFGSKSGFDDIEECFEDLTPHIHALETGLSSDPPMNRLLSQLDPYVLVSNSDAHSPAKLGREANLFETALRYDAMVKAMTHGQGFSGTIEFFPEEGKYHLDGHRKCQVRLHPGETKSQNGICPVCGKPVTVGVFHRVDDLADREHPKLSKAFFSLIPLTEILSEIHECGPGTKKVTRIYEDLINTLGPELHILMDASLKEINGTGGILLSEAIDRMRNNKVISQEGYDGEYGVIRLFDDGEKDELLGQIGLFKTKPKKPEYGKEKTQKKKTTPKKKDPDQQPVLPFTDSILDPLNPEQREAVIHGNGHLLIVAGPGTGKTMTLTHRIAYLLRSGSMGGGNILALTFTHKAAREMKERLLRLIGHENGKTVFVSTFHGFCLDVLRRDGHYLDLLDPFSICSETDTHVLAEEAVFDAGNGKNQKNTARRFLKNLSQLKLNTILKLNSVSNREPDSPLDDLSSVFTKYQEKLRHLGMLDLDDLEVETLRLFNEHSGIRQKYALRFPRIFVDEYQDTNQVQVKLLKRMVYAGTNKSENIGKFPSEGTPWADICAIGDPNQAIYGFRGANIANFHGFADDFPAGTRITLTKNYRSTQNILDLSARLMNEKRPLHGTSGYGSPVYVAQCRTHLEEAEMIIEQIEKLIGGTTHFSLDSERVASHEDGENIGFGDMAVLFRLNAMGDALEEAFLRAGIPFVRSGEKPLIEQYPANIIWRLLQTLNRPDNDYYRSCYLNLLKPEDHGESIISRIDRKKALGDMIGQAVQLHGFDPDAEEIKHVLDRVIKVAENYHHLPSFLDVLALERGIDHRNLIGDRVPLMSLHAAKGLEWPVVFVIGCENRLLPCTLFGDRDDEEERRLLYVGLTRAKLRLILSHASRRTLNGRPLEMNISPFLELFSSEQLVSLERSKWKRKPKAHEQLSLF
ncbi:MAG: UvrD-helicase domain-containing protein [Deltaproteobacteria bacterium]|nr:UvrD-helicase domain-containing protein [Deltaproteobacteria bacterium]